MRLPPELTLGRFSAMTEDAASVFRHEYGHHLKDNLFALGKKREFQQWETIYKSKPKGWWNMKVSGYGSSNSSEAFSESFAAYSSPKYTSGALPKEVEKFFKNLLGA